MILHKAYQDGLNICNCFSVQIERGKNHNKDFEGIAFSVLLAQTHVQSHEEMALKKVSDCANKKSICFLNLRHLSISLSLKLRILGNPTPSLFHSHYLSFSHTHISTRTNLVVWLLNWRVKIRHNYLN